MSSDYYRNPATAAAYDATNGPEHDITREDIPFYARLARRAAASGLHTLELGCGTGRVTLPMAHTGAQVTGLDNAGPMLDIARTKARAATVHIEWVEADMAEFKLGHRFGLVVIPFRSFQLLATPEAQVSCLNAVRRHLSRGGYLAFNLFNPAPLAALTNPAYGASIKQRNVQQNADGATFTQAYRGLRLRWVHREEMEGLLREAGFIIEALYGWFNGTAWTPESTEQVWIARLP